MSKNIYKCSSCNNIFTWTSSASWYGSYKDLENHPKRIKYFCSKECADKFNPITNKTEK